MRRLLELAALAAACHTGAPAQMLVPRAEGRGRELEAAFEKYWKSPDANTLKASVVQLHPWMDFGLRAWAGYTVELSPREFETGRAHELAVVFRVTALAPSGPPALFFWRTTTPAAQAAPPRPANVWQFSGGWLMGPGEYRVEWIVMDEKSRMARKTWTVKAAAGKTPSPLAPGTVQEAGPGIWKGFTASEHASRVHVFLEASTIRPHRYATNLPAWDRQVLLSSLGTLMRDGRFTSARVTVLDMERRKVRFDSPAFDPQQMRNLRASLAQVDLGTIEFDTLKDRPTENAFLEAELEESTRAEGAPDVVVFLGPSWRAAPRAAEPPAALKERVPRAFFIAFSRPGVVPESAAARLVNRLKGKVFTVARPEDLASAIREISERH